MAVKIIETRILSLSLVAIVAVETAAGIFLAKTLYSLLIARLLEIFLLVLVVSIWSQGMSSVGLAPDKIFAGLKKGVIWSAAFGLCAISGFAILHAAHIPALKLIRTDLPYGTHEVVLFFFMGGLVAPVAEEVFFRGIIYGFLRRWGMLVALFGSALIFVLCHTTGSGVPLTQIVGGLLFAVAYEVAGNLMVPITIHVLGNMAIFGISLVMQ